MKWIAALLGLVCIGGLLYLFLVRDRSFQSYDGAQVGMPIGPALRELEHAGWTRLAIGSNEIKQSDCTGTEKYSLVQLRSPDYLVTISSDSECNVSEISRSLRNMEL
ncbi:MAG: hypothetical protein KF780_08560 [Sphingomonas sp.]|nr:hypothetical protein [Sphingomonas sp.]